MNCEQRLRVQALFDGELDATEDATVRQHLTTCGDCRAWLSDLGALHEGLQAAREQQAPAELRQRILRSLELERPERRESQPRQPEPLQPVPIRPAVSARRVQSFWLGVLSGAGGLAAAAALAIVLWLPGSGPAVITDLATDHERSLLPDRLIAVESSDHHTVKPWFAGRADVSPVVADFDAQGFKLVGGRTDPVGGQRAAVMVYRHQLHVINVFAWKAGRRGPPRDAVRDGYHLVFWDAGDLRYCAVSDAGWTELRELKGLLQALDARDRAG
ncbi:MAG: zf-HC2 domain-containing protein [Steroidobacteraceae bacterium]